MCIIAIKEKNVPPIKKKVLKHCWDNNPDGAGFAVLEYDKGIWHVEKGFQDWDKFWRAFNKHQFTAEDIYVVHFRIGTSGNKDGGNTHPFPLFKDRDEMREYNFSTPYLAVHNGICGLGEGIYSDTIEAICDYANPIMKVLVDNPEYEYKDQMFNILTEGLEATQRRSRWIITNGILYWTLGKGWEKDDNGVTWSNGGYKLNEFSTRNPKRPIQNTPNPVYSSYRNNPYHNERRFVNGRWCRWNSNKRIFEEEVDDNPNGTYLNRLMEAHDRATQRDSVLTQHTDDTGPPARESLKNELRVYPSYDDRFWTENNKFDWVKWEREKNQAMMDQKHQGFVDPAGIIIPYFAHETPEHSPGHLTPDGRIVWDNPADEIIVELMCPACYADEDCLGPSPYNIGDRLCLSCGCVFESNTGEITYWDPEVMKEGTQHVIG